jgi:phytoene dehydrogenase-like protein
MAQRYDVIVIGGGHNGLVNAAYLAKAGKKVLALERRHVLGGAAVTEEIIPGFLFSECSYVVSLLRPEIIRELDLPRFGLEILPLDGTFTPMPSGNYLWRMNDHARTQREIRRHSRVDAEAYDEFSKMMTPMCRFVKPILSMIPPDPTTLNPRDLKQLHFLIQRFRSLSSDERYTLIQLMTMSAVDFLDQWFETDVLKATMAASGIIGTLLGIRSPGTAYVLLHHYMGEIDGAFRSWGFSRGGTGAISNAIAAAAREAGVEIRTQAGVDKILVKNGRAIGVVLKSGEEISAAVVSSSVDPHLTFEKFLEPRELPADFLESVRRYKFRGSSGKVNLALDALPDFKSMPGPGAHLRGAISISPSIEYMERAYDDAKYGRFSRRPYIDIVIPSLTDPSVAPPGKHVMSCFVHYAPYKLAQGNWDDQRDAFGDTVVNTIAEHAPNIKKIITGRQILTPLDLEREFGLTQGNIFQGELSLEQLFFLRPVPGWAYYRTPIHNLYMCGSATHPGGGIMGAPGRIASQAILKDWKKISATLRSRQSRSAPRSQPPTVIPPPQPPATAEPPVEPAVSSAVATEVDRSAIAPEKDRSAIARDLDKN